jgi:signal transduction histidine kinase
MLARHWNTGLAALLGTVYVAECFLETGVRHQVPSAAVGALFGIALAIRRRAPLAVLAVAFAIIVLDNTALRGLAQPGAFLFGVVIAIYSAGRWGRGRWLLACAGVVFASIPFAAIEPGQPVGFADFAFFTMFFAGPFVIGWVIRRRAEGERALEQHAAREAVTEERARIARELHDVVAHAISVIVLQARGGRRMLDADPAETLAALDTIERAGEQALGEMRRLLGMLREVDHQPAFDPQPGLARLADLAAELARTGLPVEVAIEGEPVELPPGIDVSAYRIVQEALTNALKHAGPASALVTLRYSRDELEIEVADDGAGTGSGGGSGHGLEGIRERVGVYGGQLDAGRRLDGGFVVHARLPLAART